MEKGNLKCCKKCYREDGVGFYCINSNCNCHKQPPQEELSVNSKEISSKLTVTEEEVRKEIKDEINYWLGNRKDTIDADGTLSNELVKLFLSKLSKAKNEVLEELVEKIYDLVPYKTKDGYEIAKKHIISIITFLKGEEK